MKKQWNPRYIAYSRAMGFNSPEDCMADCARRHHGSTTMHEFVFWNQNKWKEFMKLNGYHEVAKGRQEVQDSFDEWLNQQAENERSALT